MKFLVLLLLGFEGSGGLSPDGGGHTKHVQHGKDACVLSPIDCQTFFGGIGFLIFGIVRSIGIPGAPAS